MRDDEKTNKESPTELTDLHTQPTSSTGTMISTDKDLTIYKTILEDLPQMIFEIGADGSITYANQETTRLFECTNEDLKNGIKLEQFFHPDDQERLANNIQRLMNGELLNGEEYIAINKSKIEFLVKLYSKPIVKDGRVVGIHGILSDITESRKTEEALKTSEAYYRTLFNNTGTAMVIFGDDSIIKSCNEQFALLANCTREEVQGKMTWKDFVAPESIDMIKQHHENRTQGLDNAPHDYEFTLLTKDKQRRAVHVFVQLTQKTRERVCSLIDVTNRKRTEQALRRSEERYELVVRGANDGIWDWDLESDTVYYSPRYKAILGYEDHEFPNLADSWKSHIHPEDHDKVVNENIKCIEGKIDHFEVDYRMRHKDGRWRWISGRGASAVNEKGTVYRLAGTHSDITARKYQEQTTSALYAISKAVGTTRDLSHLFESIHSILNEVINATNFFISIYDEESDSTALTYWEDEIDTYGIIKNVSSPETKSPTAHIIRTGEPLFLSKQTPESTKDWDKYGVIGTPAACWIGVPLRVQNTIIGTMTVQHYSDPYVYSTDDMELMEAASEQVALAIERKRSNEALTQLNEKLESKVEERTAELKSQTLELEKANKRLTELDAIKSALVSSISHELRTPLTSIRGFAKLAGKDFQRFFHPLASTPSLKKRGLRINSNLDIIENEGERLTRLINDFLDINRIESGKASWNDITFNPADIVGMAASALSGVFAEKPDVELITDLPNTVSKVHADPDKIQQVVINLLGNAAKFTTKGTVTVSLKDNVEAVTVSVTDTGPGIPADEQDEIFEKFHKSQKGDTITNAERGTGLGLAICKEIVSHYDGSIWVDSKLGKGSVFSFSLPTKC
jgi:PAS domain S-box-containing protein